MTELTKPMDTRQRLTSKFIYLPFFLLGLLLLAVPVVAQEKTSEPPVYVVQPGDTLYQIAQRFETTVEAIVAANDIADARLIHVGQELIIPTDYPELVPSLERVENRRLHRVRLGETLPSLAFRYRTTIWALEEANELVRYGLLLPGQDLIIPPPVRVITGTPTFPDVTANPEPVQQGQTVRIGISTTTELTLTGSFLGQALNLMPVEEGYWALAGIDALTSGGEYPVNLTITETETGDLLAVQQVLTITTGDFGVYNIVVPADRQGLLDPVLVEAERKLINAAFAEWTDEQYWQGAFDPPLAGDLVTTAPFGQRRSYNGGPVASYHSGHDYDGEIGTPVLAPAAGRVVVAEPLQVRGQVVIIDHGLGVLTGFWHLSQIDVTAGEMVERGQVVGLLGNTGLSTGAHLHWEMRVNGVPVHPVQWMQQSFP